MKVSDLQKVQEIDSYIQDLLNELANLYQQRSELFANKKNARGQGAVSSQEVSRSPYDKLNGLDFSKFDLSIND